MCVGGPDGGGGGAVSMEVEEGAVGLSKAVWAEGMRGGGGGGGAGGMKNSECRDC